MSDCYTLFPCIQRVTNDTAEAYARSSRGAKWLLHHRDSHSALDFPNGYRDMTFALFALRPRESESNPLMFLVALLPGLSLLQDRAECLFAWFHIVTARCTLVAYRY